MLARINRSYDALAEFGNEERMNVQEDMEKNVLEGFGVLDWMLWSIQPKKRKTSGWKTQKCRMVALDFDLPPPLMVVRQIKTSSSTYFLMQGQTCYVVIFISIS